MKRVGQQFGKLALVAVLLAGAQSAGADHLYWADAGEESILRSATDGSGTVTLANFEMNAAEYLAIDSVARKIYWVDRGKDQIGRANLDGTGTEVLFATADPTAIAVDPGGGKFYWTSDVDGTLSRANLDGTGIEELHSGLSVPTGVAVDPLIGRVFWTEAGTDMIRSSTLAGADIVTLVDGLLNPIGIAAHPAAGWIFWTESTADKVSRIDVDGNNRLTLASEVSFYNLRGIAVDPVGGRLFFTSDYILGKMFRMNFDGGDRTEVITGEGFGPIGVAADPVTGEFYWWHSGDGVFYRTSPLVAGSMTVTHAGMSSPEMVVHDPELDLLLWSDSHHIFRMNDDGGGFRRVLSDMARSIQGLAMDPVADKIYWVTEGGLYRANYDGTAPEWLDNPCLFQSPTAIAVDAVAGKIYWSRITSPIQRSNLDGSGCEELTIPGLSNPYSLAIDSAAGMLYIGDHGTDRLLRYNVNTQALDPLIDPAQDVTGIAIGPGGQKIYWSQSYGLVKRANLADGAAQETIVPAANAPRGLATESSDTPVRKSSWSSLRSRF